MAVATYLQNDFSWGQISERLYARIDIEAYVKGLKRLENAYPYQQGGIRRRSGTKAAIVLGTDDVLDEVRLIPLTVSNTISTLVLFYNYTAGSVGAVRFVENGEYLQTGSFYPGTTIPAPVEVAHPYLNSELKDLRYTQVNRNLIITHPNHAPRRLTRISATSWELVPFEFRQQAISDIWSEFRGLRFNIISGTIPFRADLGRGYGDQFIIVLAADGTSTITRNIQDPDANSSNNDPASAGFSEFVAPANGYCFVEKAAGDFTPQTIYLTCIRAAGNITYWDIQSSVAGNPNGLPGATTPFNWKAGNYPSACCWHQQRLWFAGTPKEPTTLWASSQGLLTDFTLGPNMDDAIMFQISSDTYDGISHMVSGRVLLVHSYSNEFSVVGAGGASIGPNSILVQPQTSHGTSSLRPMKVGNEIIYAQRDGKKLRATSYSVAQDAYVATDFSLLADDLANIGMRAAAFAQDPDFVIWVVMQDGTLCSVTISQTRDQAATTVAWAKHSTRGEYLDVTALQKTDSTEIWFAVRRNNGHISVERMVEDERVLVDCGYVLENAGNLNTTTLTLSEQAGFLLNGLECDVVVDGKYHARVTPVAGSVTLTFQATEYVTIGLPYQSVIEMLHPEIGQVINNIQADQINVYDARIRFKETVCARYSVNDGQEYEIPFMEFGLELDKSIKKFSGDKRISPEGWKNPYNLKILQDKPFPFSILGIILRLAVNPK